MKTKEETIKIKIGSYAGTDDWLMKEYGSWEDHNCSDNHVCAILQREIDKPYMELTKQEVKILYKSICYQLNAGWDSWNDNIHKLTTINCWKGYKNRLEKAKE